MHANERGFTIVEVLVAGAIMLLVTLAGLATCKAIAAATAGAAGERLTAATLDAQAAQLRADAVTAFAIFVPPTDMNGAPNDPASGHEVDYFTTGDHDRRFSWRYFYDAGHQTLQRFDYDADGTQGVRDPLTGRIETSAAYPPIHAITAFTARTIEADALGDPDQNVYSRVATLFAHPPVAHAVNFERTSPELPAPTGGNAVVQVVLASARAARVVHVSAGTLPAGFTVTGLPRWHAILYRVDQTHRDWLGVAGKSHVFIRAHIDVSYDGWQSRTSWCDFNVLGDPDGLDPHDPHADYKPDEAVEQTDALFARCRELHPSPPARGSAGNPPEPGGGAQPLPLTTPPACWSAPGPQGRCWPPDAPVNWNPPAPLPADTPPPVWCATHAQSTACGAAPPAPNS